MPIAFHNLATKVIPSLPHEWNSNRAPIHIGSTGAFQVCYFSLQLPSQPILREKTSYRRSMFCTHGKYRKLGFKDSENFKNLYKIEYWFYGNKMPGFEEISVQRIREKWWKKSKMFGRFSKNKKSFSKSEPYFILLGFKDKYVFALI